ncbi:Protein of unknown function [Burkholderia sp. OK233]|nr:Protein of unknown function [Burkholderia sp. OK233]
MEQKPNTAQQKGQPYTDNHYVPKFLLDEWCVPDPKRDDARFLHAIGHGYAGPAIVTRVPRHVANSPFLYGIKLEDGHFTTLLESGYFTPKIDTRGAAAHSKLASVGVDGLSETERMWWARFLCAQMIRVPSMAERMHELLKHDSAFEGASVESLKYGLDSDEEELIDEVAEKVGENVVIHAPAWFPVTIAALVRTRPFLTSHWLVRDIPPLGNELLLSDNPFILSSRADDEDFICALPLTPRKLFIAASPQSAAGKLSSVEISELVRETNEFVVSNATKWVFATDDRLADFVTKHLPLAQQ